jgi:hypothetical protein
MELMWPFIAWMFSVCIVGTAILVVINKLFMYHGHEDTEIWNEGEKHFIMANVLNDNE